MRLDPDQKQARALQEQRSRWAPSALQMIAVGAAAKMATASVCKAAVNAMQARTRILAAAAAAATAQGTGTVWQCGGTCLERQVRESRAWAGAVRRLGGMMAPSDGRMRSTGGQMGVVGRSLQAVTLQTLL